MKLLSRNIIVFGSFSRRAEVILQKEIAYYFVYISWKTKSEYMIFAIWFSFGKLFDSLVFYQDYLI